MDKLHALLPGLFSFAKCSLAGRPCEVFSAPALCEGGTAVDNSPHGSGVLMALTKLWVLRGHRAVSLCCLVGMALLPLPGLAQLSSPMPAGVAGTGPGVHSPNSPFAPLRPRDDVLPWSLLSDVKLKKVSNRLLPDYPPHVLRLDNKRQRVQGFMMPLEPGQRQKHFLLASGLLLKMLLI